VYYLQLHLDNENANKLQPHDMDTNLILTNDQAAVNAIRAAGANQLYEAKYSSNLKTVLTAMENPCSREWLYWWPLLDSGLYWQLPGI
jgi:hypothetical protein